MKKIYTLLMAGALSLGAVASDVRLIVEKVNNQGLVPGDTYRVWAQMASPDHSLHIVWGDVENPLSIESTAPFYQHPYGGFSSSSIAPALSSVDLAVACDSWVTIGYQNNEGNDLWDLGIDFSTFNTGGEILANNGAWFLIPTDEKCAAEENGMVLLAQFTTTGVASGRLNLQGWTAPNQKWQALGLTFTTAESFVFGCTDSKASNYNADATFDDGSCIESNELLAVGDLNAQAENWQIFPNPLRDNLLHVQFNTTLSAGKERANLQIMDMSGKMVGTHNIVSEQILPGNRLTLTQDLAAGTYKVILTQGSFSESKTLIVQK